MDLNYRFFFLFFFSLEAHEEFLFISRSFFSFCLLVEARIAEQ